MEGLDVTPGFWAGRRVLLTGSTGFKGAWLTLWLKRLGAKVHGYALAPATTPSLYELAELGLDGESEFADIRDIRRLTASCAAFAPEVVLHLAAQSLVRPSYEDPLATFNTNVMGTAHVLEAVRKTSGVRAVVVVTSDKCYDNREWERPYRENDSLGGHDPYSASKAGAELVTASFYRSFLRAASVGVSTARAGNVIGGGDWSRDRLLPDVVLAMAQGRVPVLRNPASTRPWQHVLDPLAGYLTLAERLFSDPERYSEAWNFGPDAAETLNVASVVEHAHRVWVGEDGGQRGGVAWEQDAGTHPHEAGMLALDASKARHDLEWRPRLKPLEAIAWTVEWYKAQGRGAGARSLTMAQLERYEVLA